MIAIKLTRVGKRGYVFSYDDLGIVTNVYLINSERYIFICDTYLGPDIMQNIRRYVSEKLEKKEIVVFNSHSDWDHIWGNCAFKDSIIISHQYCQEEILNQGEQGLEEHKEYMRGEVEIFPPNLTFTDKLIFPAEGVEFFYSPGHTKDSASCYDQIDKVLFVGDNVEEPEPYLQWGELERYLETLENYLNIDVETLIVGHNKPADLEMIKRNIEYIKSKI